MEVIIFEEVQQQGQDFILIRLDWEQRTITARPNAKTEPELSLTKILVLGNLKFIFDTLFTDLKR